MACIVWSQQEPKPLYPHYTALGLKPLGQQSINILRGMMGAPCNVKPTEKLMQTLSHLRETKQNARARQNTTAPWEQHMRSYRYAIGGLHFPQNLQRLFPPRRRKQITEHSWLVRTTRNTREKSSIIAGGDGELCGRRSTKPIRLFCTLSVKTEQPFPGSPRSSPVYCYGGAPDSHGAVMRDRSTTP